MMHTRHRTNAFVDGESLQADVMRFMAIIAFCLVAIMALVRDVQPPDVEREPLQTLVDVPASVLPEAPKLEPEAELELEPEPEPEPVAPVVDVVQKAVVQAVPKLAAPLPAAPIQAAPSVDPIVDPVMEIVPEPAPEPYDVVSEPSTPQNQDQVEDQEGLTLRFGTDRDFLRLIAKGDVGVYLFRDQQAYRLTKSYGFGPAQAPRQLYELMPSTIPGAIRSAAENSNHELAGFRWGVAMPERISARIQRLVAVERNGELVINRFGEVVHRAPSKLLRAEG